MARTYRQLEPKTKSPYTVFHRTRGLSVPAFLVCALLLLLPATSALARDMHVRSSEPDNRTDEESPTPSEEPKSQIRKQSDLPVVRRETSLIASEPYVSPTFDDRIDWAIRRSLGWRGLVKGALQSGIKTWQNTPEEWGSGWEGFGKRFGTRQADVLISGTVEASLGALWGEDPRYWRSGKEGTGSRIWYAVSSSFLTYRPDGTRKFAWARLVGNVSGDAVVRRWYPEADRDWYKWTLTPLGTGFIGKMFSNVFREFSPDLKQKFLKKGNKQNYKKKDKQDKKTP